MIYTGFIIIHYKSNDTIINNAITKQESFNNHSGHILYIDLNKPIFLPRLYLINVKTKKIKKTTFVFTSFKSGRFYATKFSNKPNTHLTSIGAFIVNQQYNGKFGYSARIGGLEKQNNNAMRRAIVIHPCGSYLYTLGCYSTFESTLKEIIPLIKNGGFMFVDHSQLYEKLPT